MIILFITLSVSQYNRKISIKTKKLETEIALIIENNSDDPLDILFKNNDTIEYLLPNERSVILFNNNSFDYSIYNQINYIKNDNNISYNDYKENIIIDKSNQTVFVEFSKETINDLKKCYGEVITYFYDNNSIVDIDKKNVLLVSNNVTTNFKSKKHFDDAKITFRFWISK